MLSFVESLPYEPHWRASGGWWSCPVIGWFLLWLGGSVAGRSTGVSLLFCLLHVCFSYSHLSFSGHGFVLLFIFLSWTNKSSSCAYFNSHKCWYMLLWVRRAETSERWKTFCLETVNWPEAYSVWLSIRFTVWDDSRGASVCYIDTENKLKVLW